jgi:pSer/pThr/pTyr-binding forkhead associated (FHA) protein
VPIVKDVFAVGRGPDVDLVLEDPTAGTLHAQILRREQALYVCDTGSRRGTFVDGRLIASAHRLGDGEVIAFGDEAWTFRSTTLPRAGTEPAAVANDLALVVRSGPSVGLAFALHGEAWLVGSAPGAAVELSHLSVAPEHARLRRHGDLVHVTDLGSGRGTSVGGTPLAPGVEVPLPEGGLLRVGAVELALVRGAQLAAAALRPRARLAVDSGPGSGSSVAVLDGALVGSGGDTTLSLPGLAPVHLEIVLANGRYLARDRSGGRSFKTGVPLSDAFVELSHGDILLLGATSLRFEEVP